jgi:hypothetical protein
MARDDTYVALVNACTNGPFNLAEVIDRFAPGGGVDLTYQESIGRALKELVKKKLVQESFDNAGSKTFTATEQQARDAAGDKDWGRRIRER